VATTTPDRYTDLLITTDLGLSSRGEVLFSAEIGSGRKALVRSSAKGDEILAEEGFLIHSNDRGTALYTKAGNLYVRIGSRDALVGAVGGQAALNAKDMVGYWDGESIALWQDRRIVQQATPAPRMVSGWVRTDHPLRLNNAGSYVLLAMLPQVPNGQSLLLRSGGRSIPIADNSGDSYSRFVRAALNDREEVAFIARMTNSTNAAFVYRAGRIETLSGLRTVSGGVDDIAINAGGVIVYGDHTGLWLGPDQEADRIVRTGDVLMGRPVSAVRLLGLNDAGQVFFTAAFGKGSQGTMLVRADPK
jgi:hypothetical protein